MMTLPREVDHAQNLHDDIAQPACGAASRAMPLPGARDGLATKPFAAITPRIAR